MLIGVTGTNGAGKGALVEYLVSAKGFSRYSARTVILDELRARHLPDTRANMREVANDLRKQHGAAYVIEKLYAMAKDDGKAVVESVRTIGEAEFLKEKGAKILAVDADIRGRYERVANNPDKELAHMTFEDFCKIEDREMASSEPWDMNVFGVMQMADVRIHNDGTMAELHQAVDAALAELSETAA
jgi:dephospho-CoA kinase